MKYKITHDGITKTYAALGHTAWHLLDIARTHEEGSLLNLQAAAVFYAFTFEAYLNHVGAEEISFWEEIERISYEKKLRVIAKHLRMTIDYGSRPFQTVGELFALRNALAHGRTIPINISYETKTPPEHDSSWNLHEWEKLTPEKVDRYAADVRAAVGALNESRSRPDHALELWNQGIRGRTVETMKES